MSFLEIEDTSVRQTFFHSMQLSRQRVQVESGGKAIRSCWDKSEVFRQSAAKVAAGHTSAIESAIGGI